MGAEAVLAALFLVAFSAWAGFYVAQPLLRGEVMREDETRVRHAQLVWEKNITLQTLKELDEDHRMKKISDEDHRVQREALLREAAERIRLVEEAERAALSAKIELEVAKRRTQNAEHRTQE
jgi:hypothetical protein